MNNLKNIRIGTQLKTGFTIIIILIAVLGIISFVFTGQMADQTKTLYRHSLEVRRSLGEITAGVIKIHRGMKDLVLAEGDDDSKSFVIHELESEKEKVFLQIGALRDRYTGPLEDVENIHDEFVKWNMIRENTVKLVVSGKLKEAADRTRHDGEGGSQVKVLMEKIRKADDFSKNRSELLFAEVEDLNIHLNHLMAIFMSFALFISIVIVFLILRNINTPVEIMIKAINKFKEGNYGTRSSYVSDNELGILSSAINNLAETIQKEMVFRENASVISAAMMAEIESQNFRFRVLSPLMELTGSQIGAIYLINDEKKEYYPVETIGLEVSNCKPFSATEMDGEFGRVLVTREICLINDIPEDTTFNFAATSGTFRPAEIMTVPLIIGNEISAVISFANIRKYSPEAIRLIHGLQNPLSTGMSAMLANRRIQKLTEELEYRNMELEAQKNELESQATELHSQNTELEMQKTRLDEANRLKTNFLSNMSHELRTPLNSVIALSGVLNRRLAGKIPEDEYSYLGVIERNGKNLLDLINDILDISRIEAGKEEIEITRFNMCDIGNDVVSLIMPQADEKGIKLLKTVDECNIQVESDERKCRHILQNLIGNAVKFTEKGTVEIIVNKDAINIEITIKDTGIGISEKNLPHIFDEFRQADGSTSRRFGGTGLGLAIAKKYAEMLGGNITVKSELGRGSEFTLILPLRYFEKTEANYVSPNRLKEGVIPTILLVEDSEPAIIQLNNILESKGHNILIARNGEEALEIISDTVPDAMILDLMMPGVDGFQVLKSIREEDRTASVPVLILTAKHITKEELSFLKRNNIHQLIQKGDVNPKDLLSTIDRMIYGTTEDSK
jgi:signal transduction histidine kinase/CheY-like chemotaxis protein